MGACFSKRAALISRTQDLEASQRRDQLHLAQSEPFPCLAPHGVTSEPARQEWRLPGEVAQTSLSAGHTSNIVPEETATEKAERKLPRWISKTVPMANTSAAGAASAAPNVLGEEEAERRECDGDLEAMVGPAFAEPCKDSEKQEGSSARQGEESTQTSSPLRRRRLSLSQSAKATEDDGKERGQTIIAVAAEHAGHVLGQQKDRGEDDGAHVLEEVKTSKTSPVETGEHRKRQEQAEVLEEPAKREMMANDQQETEQGKDEREISPVEAKTSLENLQRRRLSLSQSARVASPGADEARGHTSVQVDRNEEKADVKKGPKPGGDKKGDRCIPQKSLSGRVKSKARGQSSGRRLSVAGLSSEGHPQTNFEDKRVEKHGEAAQKSLAHFGIGICCKKGFKPESPNQDDFFVIKVDKWSLYGVFDGHGPAGHDVSNYVQRELPSRLLYGDIPFLQMPLRALQQSFRQVHKELEQQTESDAPGCTDCSMSGTTATVVLHLQPEKKLYIAHVGDSRAVLAQWDTSTTGDTSKGKKCSRLVALDLTLDHKPTNDLERQRIIRTGGQIRRLEGDVPHRVFLKNRLFPGLAMSRAIGDTLATQAGVIPDPDVKEFQLVEGRDEFLLICSDGVWEFISSQEAVEIVEPFGRRGVQDACEVLARESWRRWIEEEHTVVDDITALIIYLS